MQEQAPPPPPVPPTPPTPRVAGQVVDFAASAGAADVYQGFKAQRRELGNQLDQLEGKRRDLSNQLQQTSSGIDRSGLEARVKEVDQRILDIEKEIASADAAVAKAAAVPGAVVTPRPEPRRGPPEEFFVMGGLFMVVICFPIAIAYARRIWRRGAAAIVEMPKEMIERFNRLEQGVDAIAVEVERIGEGQRFMSRVMSDEGGHRAIGAGAAVPIELREREGALLRRDR